MMTTTRLNADTEAARHAAVTGESVEIWRLRRGLRHEIVCVVHPPGTVETVVLVGCSATKLDRPAAAADLYASPLFSKSLSYALHLQPPERVFIASAKHGLVRPTTDVIAPYDETLVGHGREARERWADGILLALERAMPYRFDPARRPPPDSVPSLRALNVVLLMGKIYADVIRENAPVGWTFVEPLRGLEIGQRLRWLNQALARCERAQTMARKV